MSIIFWKKLLFWRLSNLIMFKIICLYLVLVVCNQNLRAIELRNFDYQYAPEVEVPKSAPMPRTTPSPSPKPSASKPTKVRMPSNAPALQDVGLDLFKSVKNVLFTKEVIIICKALKLSLVFTQQVGYSLWDNHKQ